MTCPAKTRSPLGSSAAWRLPGAVSALPVDALDRGVHFSWSSRRLQAPLAASRGPSSYRGAGSGSTRTVPWAGREGGGCRGGLRQRRPLLSSWQDGQFPALGPSGPPAHFPLPLILFSQGDPRHWESGRKQASRP